MTLLAPDRRRRRLVVVLLGVVGVGSVVAAVLAVGAGPDAIEGGPLARTAFVGLCVAAGVLYVWAASRSWRSQESWLLEPDAIVHTDHRGRPTRWPTSSIGTAHVYTAIVGRFPQPRLALRDRDGAIVADAPLGSYRVDEFEAAFLDIGVGVTREQAVAPVDVSDRRPAGQASVRVLSPRRRTYVALLVGAMLVPVAPAVLGVALGLGDTVLGLLLLVAVVGPYVGMVLVVRRTRALTLSPDEVRLGAGRRSGPGIPRAEVRTLEVVAKPLGSLVRLHLRDGRIVDHPLLGVRPARVRDAAIGLGLPAQPT